METRHARTQSAAEPSSHSKAPNVCSVCKARKKACDKVIPSCGFCSSRGLTCRYDVHAPDRSKRTYCYNPGRRFVALPIGTDCSSPDATKTALGRGANFHHVSQCDFDARTVAEQAKSLIDTLDISYNKLGAQYFDRCHDWLHVISPAFFEQLMPKGPGEVVSADVSVLLLSMLLLTSLTNLNHQFSRRASNCSARFFYNRIKSLFSQAQGEVCASIPLIQAGLLLAECEYACVRPRVAYVTVAMCNAMARAIGIADAFDSTERAQRKDISEFALEEELVVAWALSMMERLVVSEVEVGKQTLLAKFPSPDVTLPPYMRADVVTAFTLVKLPTLNAASLNIVNEYGQQAQAIALLNEVLATLNLMQDDEAAFLSQHADLDEKLRCFLTLLLNQKSRRETSLSVSVAISVRAMFLLHRNVLHGEDKHNVITDETRQAARLALDTVCEMITEVLRIFGPPSVESIPLPCFYNMWNVMKHIQQSLELDPNPQLLSDQEVLAASIQQYQDKWHL